MSSIALVFSAYNEALSLPGMIESAQWFSDIFCIHAGPGGKPSNDGTIELLQKYGVRYVMGNIDEGFGHIRTRLIHESKADFCYVADCDERFYPVIELLTCDGDEKYPESKSPNILVKPKGILHNQGALLMRMLDEVKLHDAIIASRRAWMDFSFRRPAQNWNKIQDLQCRIVRNVPHVGYQRDVKMHEKIVDYRTGKEPRMVKFDPSNPIFLDHFHNFFKPLHPEKNAEDIATYRRLSPEGARDMWLNHAPGGA